MPKPIKKIFIGLNIVLNNLVLYLTKAIIGAFFNKSVGTTTANLDIERRKNHTGVYGVNFCFFLCEQKELIITLNYWVSIKNF